MRRTQPLLRRLLGRWFHFLASAWVVGPVQDTQCGFKGFTRAAAHDLFSRQRITSIVFDVELIHLARRRGYRIAVVPVAWTDRRGSRMRARPSLALQVAWDLFRIRFLHRAGDAQAASGRPPPTMAASVRLAGLQAAARRLLPLSATAVFVGSIAFSLLVGVVAGTVGFDYLAYDAAARRLLAGALLYDTSFRTTGVFGLFYYPPQFVFGLLPLTLLPADVGIWVWAAISTAAVVAAIWLMPVGSTARWSALLLAGLSWPVVFAIGLGQVGPLLLLLFAVGWRWIHSDAAVGLAGAVGAMIKIQPALVLVWALLRGRWRAVGVGALALVLTSALATAVVTPRAWFDLVTLATRVGDPIEAPRNVTLGALLHGIGFDRSSATILHWLFLALVGAGWVFIVVRRAPVVGYLATVVVSQLASPLLWDHYAMVLLLPVAYLLDRGRWWAALVPLASPWLLAGQIPGVVYPLVYVATLWGLVVERSGGRAASRCSCCPGWRRRSLSAPLDDPESDDRTAPLSPPARTAG
ncbi:MAG: hypothetical protein KatS3mg065_0874 [Chloroflexota bacterium]|nr:MAG: hypothetical protein KatS3mg065_0874 [Chloroflexota bacterium]